MSNFNVGFVIGIPILFMSIAGGIYLYAGNQPGSRGSIGATPNEASVISREDMPLEKEMIADDPYKGIDINTRDVLPRTLSADLEGGKKSRSNKKKQRKNKSCKRPKKHRKSNKNQKN